MVRCYRESVLADGSAHLWGNAAYGMAVVATQCFLRTGWLADIHGVSSDGVGAGVVWRHPDERDVFEDDRSGSIPKPATDVMIPDWLEKELSSLGFLTLAHRHGSSVAAFCNTPSIYSPENTESLDERISALLQYTLCAARFAHELKRLGHETVGEHRNVDQVKSILDRFFGQFVLSNSDSTAAQKAERPLRKYDVVVRPSPGRPGHFECDIQLQMHHDLEAVRIELTTELSGKGS